MILNAEKGQKRHDLALGQIFRYSCHLEIFCLKIVFPLEVYGLLQNTNDWRPSQPIQSERFLTGTFVYDIRCTLSGLFNISSN